MSYYPGKGGVVVRQMKGSSWREESREVKAGLRRRAVLEKLWALYPLFDLLRVVG